MMLLGICIWSRFFFSCAQIAILDDLFCQADCFWSVPAADPTLMMAKLSAA